MYSVQDCYAYLFGRPSFEKLNKFVFQCGLRGLGCLNWSTDYLSGETAYAIELLQRFDNPGAVIIDVGANEGGFIQSMLTNSKHIQFIGVEPHPVTFRRLANRFQGNPRVQLHECCLGKSDGSVLLYDHSVHSGSEQASLFSEAVDAYCSGMTAGVEVKMTSLDSLIGDLPAIAVIKLDVEGFESEVIKGARKTIDRYEVPEIILEFNSMNVLSRTFFKDLRQLLPDYMPSRILPGGRLLQLREYGAWKEEIFAYQNIAFTRRKFL